MSDYAFDVNSVSISKSGLTTKNSTLSPQSKHARFPVLLLGGRLEFSARRLKASSRANFQFVRLFVEANLFLTLGNLSATAIDLRDIRV